MDTRGWFAAATDGFVELARGVDSADWSRTGLGEWDVRALTGHTSRALVTVESYLAADVLPGHVALSGPADYYRAARAGLADPALVTERGRQAGIALGADPAYVVGELAARVLALVAATGDEAPVATPVGVLRLIDYLPTRAFELTVHGLDLAGAAGRPVPAGTRAGVPSALGLACELTDEPGQELLLRALTGRTVLPAGFSVL